MYSNFREDQGLTGTIHGKAPPLVPDEAAAVALLQHLEKSDLQALLNDDSKLGDLVTDLQQVRNMKLDQETMLARNKSLADFNLTLQPRFVELKRQVATAYEDANKLKMALGTHVATLDTGGKGPSTDTTLALLQTEAAKADEDTEQLADDFCDKKIEVDTFKNEYIAKRASAHILRIKAEKMAELVQNQTGHTANASNNYSWETQTKTPGVSAAPYPTGQPTVTPYPTGAMFNMPDPNFYRPR